MIKPLPIQKSPASGELPIGITELVLASQRLSSSSTRGCAHSQSAFLIPMLTYLQHQNPDRWITWVVSESQSRQIVQDQAMAQIPVRLIHCQSPEDVLWITWEALAKGNSHTVLASPEFTGEKILAQLEQAALQGQSQGLLLRWRN